MNVLAVLCGALLLAAAASGARASEVVSDGLSLCDSNGCRPTRFEAIPASDLTFILVQRVTIDPATARSGQPLMVRIVALASSEVRWNGTVIGRNGMPGLDAAHEEPGRLVATFLVPSSLVRSGANHVSARLSSHHLWLPARTRIYAFEVAPYVDAALPGLGYYLPSLLVAGAFAAAFAYFGFAFLIDRANRLAAALAAAGAAGIVQLGLETVRVFVNYPYPWHIARVLGIAICAGAIAIAMTYYAAARLVPPWRWWAMVATAIAALTAVALIPWYDIKAIAAIVAGSAVVAACGVAAWRGGDRVGAVALGIAAAFIGLLLVQRSRFLDLGWYILLAGTLMLLVVEQVRVHALARRSGEAAHDRAAALEHRLDRLANAADDFVLVKEGARTHRVREGDVIAIHAADDYSELRLADGRTILATATLSRLLADFSDRFVRIHRSHAVNRAHVTMVLARAGARAIRLSDGSELPVGRRHYEAAESIRRPGEG